MLKVDLKLFVGRNDQTNPSNVFSAVDYNFVTIINIDIHFSFAKKINKTLMDDNES